MKLGTLLSPPFLEYGVNRISNGLSNVLGSSTWAEIYGVKNIGSIKSLTSGLMVVSTAFGTALFGILIDKNFSIEQIALVSGSYILIAISLLFLLYNENISGRTSFLNIVNDTLSNEFISLFHP